MECLQEDHFVRRWRVPVCVAGLLLLLPCGACQMLFPKPQTTEMAGNILDRGELPRDCVTIEVYHVRMLPQQHKLIQDLWLEVDEQVIGDSGLRRNLINQGIRVGIQGAVLSNTLAKLINVTEDAGNRGGQFGQFQEVAFAENSLNPSVSLKILNLTPDMQASLKIFDDPLPEFSLFWVENNQYCGRTFGDALGLLNVSAQPQSNGMVRFTLLPELEYGTSERKIQAVSGHWILSDERPRRVSHDLRVTLDLYPGQWIIVGPSSQNTSGLGRVFFSRGAEGNEQKILAIRLANVKKEDRSTGRSDTMPLPEREAISAFPTRH